MSSIFRKKRAQAAVELLTTYGWAIIGVLVVIGALAYFDVFDAKRFVSERCDTGSQIQCMGVYINNQGEFELQLKNNYLVPVDIESVIMKVGTENRQLVEVGSYMDYTVQVEPGNNTRFQFRNHELGYPHKGTKQELTTTITFRRHVPNNANYACGFGGATCYNITGNIVVKVQDAATVPAPSQT